MKVFFWTMVAVVAGIWVYSKFGKTASKTAKRTVAALGGLFNGPDVDPTTGGYLAPDAKVGTVEFPAQGN